MKRLLTGLLLVPTFTYVILLAPEWLFTLVVVLIAAACYHEYHGIASGYGVTWPEPAALLAGLVLLIAPSAHTEIITLFCLAAMGFSICSASLAQCLPRAALSLLGVVYVFGGWRTSILLRAASPYWLFFATTINWVGDTAAYYTGRVAGRHRMAPVISPAKSWEGAIASLAASLIYGYFLLGWALPQVTPWRVLLLAAAGNVAGQVGDLAESALKRGAGVKDSGNLLPGHGGWLDRVDSTLFSMPVVLLLLQVLR